MKPDHPPNRRLRTLECAVLFFILPGVARCFRHNLAFTVVPVVAVFTVGCFVYLKRDPEFDDRRLWRVRDLPRHLREMVLIAAALLPAMAYFSYIQVPSKFLAFPRDYPFLWLAVMVVYPLVSAVPQEIVFRAFFFHRYRAIVTNTNALIVLSALSFGVAHLLYNNWIAPVLAGFGGLLFGWRYVRSESALITGIEHGIWGNILFTLGVGWFFYSGSIR